MASSLLAAFALACFIAQAQEPQPVDPPDRRCRIHGRIVDERGAPIAGARVVAHGSTSNRQRVERHGLPTQWTDPEVLGGEDGSFELRFVPPQAFEFTVVVEHDDFADVGWRWSQIAEGQERAQGDVTLERAGSIEGFITTRSGDLLVEQWIVVASLESRLAHHAGITPTYCAIDPATGAFRFDDLPPGRISLHPMHRTGDKGPPLVVETSPEVTTQAVLQYHGPDPTRRIRLQVSGKGPAANATSQVAEGALRAVGTDGAVYTFARHPSRGGEYWAIDLPSGDYRIEIEDPRFEWWEQAGVRPGETVRAALEGRARLRATILGPDGAPLSSYGLNIQQTGPFQTSHVHELQSVTTAPPPDGVYPGLLDGTYDFRVTAPGCGRHCGVIEGLNAGATYELVVRLSPARSIRGRVVQVDGSPVTGGTVQLTLGNVPGHDLGPQLITNVISDEQRTREESIPYRDASASFDAEGAFDLGEHAALPAVVRVVLGDWVRHDVRVDLAALDGPLVVTPPPLGSIEGAVSFPRRRPRCALYMRPAELDSQWLGARITDPARSGVVDAEGRFELGPLFAGPQELELIEIDLTGDARLDSVDVRHMSGASVIERLRVDVAPGAPTPYELDLGPERPTARVAVSVTLTGEPATGWNLVQLTPLDRFDASGRERVGEIGRCWTNPCILERVSVGAHRVTVFHSDLWAHTAADPIEVGVGGETRLAIDVPVVRRDLRVLNADGTPCASSELWVGPLTPHSSDQPSGVVFFTSADGVVALALPIGRYATHLGARVPSGMARPRTTELEWRAGEAQLEVRLPAQ